MILIDLSNRCPGAKSSVLCKSPKPISEIRPYKGEYNHRTASVKPTPTKSRISFPGIRSPAYAFTHSVQFHILRTLPPIPTFPTFGCPDIGGAPPVGVRGSSPPPSVHNTAKYGGQETTFRLLRSALYHFNQHTSTPFYYIPHSFDTPWLRLRRTARRIYPQVRGWFSATSPLPHTHVARYGFAELIIFDY